MQFRLFGIPVYVSMAFWLSALLLGALSGRSDSRLFATAIAVAFVAVLVHELGHAAVARAFGRQPAIVLHAFGGHTSFQGELPRGRRLLVTAAGPLAGFALGAAAYAFSRVVPLTGIGPGVLRQILFCTFGWGIINLLPVLPLDGGLIVRDVLGPRHGRATLIISAIVGAAITALLLKVGMFIGGIMFAVMTLRAVRDAWAYEEVQAETVAREDAARQQLASAEAAFERGNDAEVEVRAVTALSLGLDAATRDRARRLLAALAVSKDDGARALVFLGGIEAPLPADDVSRAQALDLVGERAAAFALLERSATADPAGPALEPLLRGLVATDAIERAVEVAVAHAARGSRDALLFLLGTLEERGDESRVSRLIGALFPRASELRDDPRFAQAAGRHAGA